METVNQQPAESGVTPQSKTLLESTEPMSQHTSVTLSVPVSTTAWSLERPYSPTPGLDPSRSGAGSSLSPYQGYSGSKETSSSSPNAPIPGLIGSSSTYEDVGSSREFTLRNSPEPPLLRLRPTSVQTQDISYLLTHLFKNLYTLDVIGEDIGSNLIKSRGGENVQHEKFVDDLQKLREDYTQKLAAADMVEKHIIEARARAMAEDERSLTNIKTPSFSTVYLPPVKSAFRWCVDSELLRKNHLICPDDYIRDPLPFSKGPKVREDVVPIWYKMTFSFKQHIQDIEAQKVSEIAGKKKKLPAIPLDVSLSTLTKCSTPEVKAPKIAKKWSQSKNKMWMNHLNISQRNRERQLLTRFEHQHNFLKNPRFYPPNTVNGGRSLIFPPKKTEPMADEQGDKFNERNFDDVPVFLAKPAVVFFTDYVIGPVYEVILELQNMTSTSRHLRVLPPSTRYFNVGLGKFPSKGGMVAPGMICQYTVRFAPDSLGDFDDFILVETQSAHTLLIPLQARRPPPVLTLAPTLNCGYCLVGGIKMTGFICKNLGLSTGRFCIMPKPSWPPPSFRAVATIGFVEYAPFGILPAVFELMPGQTLLLELSCMCIALASRLLPSKTRWSGGQQASLAEKVLFLPTSLETVTRSFTIVCDNCQTKEITISGTGQLVALELLCVSGEISYPRPGQLTDLTSQHFIQFESQNIQTTSSKRLIVRNTTHVALPFHWQIVQPNLLPLLPGETWTSKDIQHHPDLETAFFVTPQKGVLQPHMDHEFILSFSPEQLKDYHSVIQIVLEEIPDPICLENKNVYEIPCIMDEVIALEIEVKGSVEPFQILLEPYAIIIPGENYIGVNVKKDFKMWNNSKSAIHYTWGKISDCHIVEVEPHTGVIDPNEKGEFELNFTGGVPGLTSQELPCQIERSPVPVVLHIEAAFKGPTLAISVSALQFGLVRLGSKAVTFINIHNTSQLPAVWKIQESPTCLEERKETVSLFTFEPSQGHILPLGTAKVTVLFEAKCCQSLQTVLELQVENGDPSYLPVYVEVQRPYVYLLSSQLVFSDMYFGVSTTATITLFNGTLLPTKFLWGKLLGTLSALCLVEIIPKSGSMGPNEEKRITLKFTAFTMEELTDLVLPCRIEGMKKALVLGISGKPKGLDVTFSIPPAEGSENQEPGRPQELCLDFGSSVPLKSLLKRQLVLTNTSAIKALFSLEFDYFGVSEEILSKKPKPPDVPPSLRRSVRIAKCVARRDFLDSLEALLSKGKGAAFLCHCCQGTLKAFQTLVIDITACSNMWGDYHDQLICKVGDLPPTIIPVHMGVVGCPIMLFRTSHLAEEPPQDQIIRFGTKISGGDTVSRTLRLNNYSPYDIRLDWEVYNPHESEHHLLDLCILYGKPFPLRDADGIEVDSKSAPTSEAPFECSYSQSSSSSDSEKIYEPPKLLVSESVDEGVPLTAEGQPKIISVILKPHDGIRSSFPYSVSPKQLVVPAAGSQMISVSFTPMTLPGSAGKVACSSYALAYMSLDSQAAREVPGKVTRPQNFHAPQFRLDLQAFVRPTRLSIEQDYQGGMVFDLQGSDLIPDDPLTGVLTEVMATHVLKVNNFTDVAHRFRLLVAAPFSVTGINPEENRQTWNQDEEDDDEDEAGDQFVLSPQQNLLIDVSFTLSLELLTYQKLPSDQMLPGVKIVQDEDGYKRMEFSQNLVFEYSNKTTQVVPLLANVTIPALQLSTSWVDFGICFVNATSSLEVNLLNLSPCKSHWVAMTDKLERHQGVFQVYPTSGIVEARQANGPPSSVSLFIHFTARYGARRGEAARPGPWGSRQAASDGPSLSRQEQRHVRSHRDGGRHPGRGLHLARVRPGLLRREILEAGRSLHRVNKCRECLGGASPHCQGRARGGRPRGCRGTGSRPRGVERRKLRQTSRSV
ncbi:deleted in lung and esophageal cancer protein 1 isoform X2 [Monodelphis domestica]|uniref:deleted in lung and esophageal cancer protein 1 isoform X2 n=1 Tax=Monodelphis domestica TaxID=13616 RepID=UPI0024E1C44B|nr:deleted in lung and esophageal cancer protein 1 isoform X2 [Monodelphis domestica]